MKTNEQLANRLKEVLTEGKWVTGTNYKEQILGVKWEDAIKKVYGLNSIADLTFHIHYYISGVKEVLNGGPLLIQDKYSFDRPEIKSPSDWDNLVQKFCVDSDEIITLVEQLSEEKLKENFVEKIYGNYHRNIDLMIEHCYYHLGQLILIKKLL